MSDSDPAIQFMLGVAGHAQEQYSFKQIKALQDKLREFPEVICRRQSMWAVRRAAKPGMAALVAQVDHIGRKTGNLRRAITLKTKWYKNKKSGLPVAVAVIGYRRSGTGDSKKTGGKIRIGNDRAFHSHLVEFGTKRRLPGKNRVVGRVRRSFNGRKTTEVIREKERVDQNEYYVMSSWNSSGPFKSGGGRTDPPYPMAFIAKIDPARGLGQMPALHPVEHAFHYSHSQMANALENYMQKAIVRAANDLADGRF